MFLRTCYLLSGHRICKIGRRQNVRATLVSTNVAARCCPLFTHETDTDAPQICLLLFDHGRLHTDFTASGLFPMLLVASP